MTDLSTLGVLGLGSLAITQAVKAVLPQLAPRAALVNLGSGIAAAFVAKLSDFGLSGASTGEIVAAGLAAALGAGVAHDKLLNPLFKGAPVAPK
jgi:pantothenate kinase